MPAIRHVAIRHFRGFEEFATPLPRHVVVVGEPGAGRSDLVEAIVRVLDPDYWRAHRADELDFHELDSSRAAQVELTIGALTQAGLDALTPHLELWDTPTEALIPELADPAQHDATRHEDVVRISYQLTLAENGRLEETTFWTKGSTPERSLPVRSSEREFLPFYAQRGMSARPLDLTGRGELRMLIDAQTGDPFETAIEDFLHGVAEAAAAFSEHPRVRASLEALLDPLRLVRRFDPAVAAEDTLRFLPEGGAVSGLLRSLSAALTLQQGPSDFPVARHGTSATAALRAGLLVAAASQADGSIVAVDDISGELDPALARHLAAKLRGAAGQAIVTARDSSVSDAFEPEEVVRLSWRGDTRQVHRGRRPVDRGDRLAQRYFAWQLAPALGASTVVVVEGIHDRLALDTLVRRMTEDGTGPSFAAAGIEIVEANGAGEVKKVAAQAKSLGLYVVALFDNDLAAGRPAPPDVTNAAGEADVVLYLPATVDLESILTDGISDADLLATLSELVAVVPGLAPPPNWRTLTGEALRAAAIRLLHGPTGSLHALFVRALPVLGPGAAALVHRLHELGAARASTGIVSL
jgi:hypothetical protein